jgi:conjugal transfer pilus assembly protein TraU
VRVACLLILCLSASVIHAKANCAGKFVNPITDICWKCLFPLSIAGRTVANPDHDRATPSEDQSFICTCGEPIPRIGIPIGFWEPFRLADVTTKPFCMVSLGGTDLKLGVKTPDGTVHSKQGGKTGRKTAFYHVHWYVYPLLYWMNLVTNLLCMSAESFDIAYMTELDPLWQDDELSLWLNPEVLLFANPVAQIACAADCAKASVTTPINTLFWCAGCQGGVYPLTGNLAFHHGGVDASILILEKMIFKLHRELLLFGSSGKKAACGLYPMPWWRKDQYKLQMTYPSVTKNTQLACNPIGRTTFIWGSNKEYPVKGEDFAYLIWRRRYCCIG